MPIVLANINNFHIVYIESIDEINNMINTLIPSKKINCDSEIKPLASYTFAIILSSCN